MKIIKRQRNSASKKSMESSINPNRINEKGMGDHSFLSMDLERIG
jgi:hypothetical protein